jgi:hypothetical protein
LTFVAENQKIVCNLTSYQFTKISPFQAKSLLNNNYWGNFFDERSNKPVISPDSSYTAFIKNDNLFVRNRKTKEEIQLSYDGSKGFYYSSYLQWSPNSQQIMAYKVRNGEDHKIYFVESSPTDQLQPKLQSRDYLKPGDQLPFKSPQLFTIATKKHIAISTELFKSNIFWEDLSGKTTTADLLLNIIKEATKFTEF